MYFLTPATSLGLRVVDPAVRVTFRAAIAVPPAPLDRSGVPARLLHLPAGACASEVAVSVGLALTLLGTA